MIKILYFARLVSFLGKSSEDVQLPATVTDVRSLLAWLRTRGGNWEKALQDNMVRVTVNRQFVELDGAVGDGDEIAIVSARP